jgi:hypothetical protein
MCKPPDDNLVSIVGSSYFQPIATLLDAMVSRPSPAASEVKTSPIENGLACSISLLAVVCFESYVMRLRYIHRAAPAAKKRSTLDFLGDLYPQFPSIDQLTEAFVLRDVVAHNHLWKIGFSWDDQLAMTLKSAHKDPISGDQKYSHHVDLETRRTRLVGLNAVPVKVDRCDASKLLKLVWGALLFLEAQDRNQCYVSPERVTFGGKLMLFGDVVEALGGRKDGDL